MEEIITTLKEADNEAFENVESITKQRKGVSIVMEKGKPSEIFEEAFDSGCGGNYRKCVCGITYFDGSHPGDWEDGELEALIEKAKTDPEHYIEVDYSLGTMLIGGEEIVIGCNCGRAKRYEDFFIHHDTQLAVYLNSRAAMLREMADSIEVKA